MKLAQTIWSNQVMAEKIGLNALETVTLASKEKFGFFTGKSTKGLLGGLFYLLGFRHGAKRTQKELARLLRTTDVTIRVSYRKWLEEFPDLFSDVVCKRAENDKIGCTLPQTMAKKTTSNAK
jgi:transcription initiation factor TFIIIB Brf1 subunit/transcription initiation factor TFIIB